MITSLTGPTSPIWDILWSSQRSVSVQLTSVCRLQFPVASAGTSSGIIPWPVTRETHHSILNTQYFDKRIASTCRWAWDHTRALFQPKARRTWCNWYLIPRETQGRERQSSRVQQSNRLVEENHEYHMLRHVRGQGDGPALHTRKKRCMQNFPILPPRNGSKRSRRQARKRKMRIARWTIQGIDTKRHIPKDRAKRTTIQIWKKTAQI